MSTRPPIEALRLHGLATHAPAALAVGLGAAIYLLWRCESLLVFELVSRLELGAALASARESAAPWSAPGWLLTSAPDGLYAFALAWSLSAMWSGEVVALDGRYVWLAAALLLTVGSELAQAASLLPGVFDVVDVALYALGGALGWRAAPLWLAFITPRRTP